MLLIIFFFVRITYNSTLSALARDSNDPNPWKNALQLMDKMQETAQRSTSRNLIPDQVSYTIALGSWLGAESVSIDDATQAYKLVDGLVRNHADSILHCKPDIPIFTTLMQVCAKVQSTSSDDSDGALEMALDAMKACTSSQYGTPNHVAYASCMKAINRLCRNRDHKLNLLQSLFERCAREGHVSKQVVISMKIGAWGDMVPPIRKEWSKNVPMKSKPRIE